MKLYFYYLSNAEIKKEIVKGVRENKKDYIIPIGNQSTLGSLTNVRYYSKKVTNVIQVDFSICYYPFIISPYDYIDDMFLHELEEKMRSIYETCNATNNIITEYNKSLVTEREGD